MMGAAIATVAAYATMAVGMAWWSQRVYPVPYQWRRVLTAALVAVALAAIGKAPGGGIAVQCVLILVYPLGLLLTGFTTPQERRRLRRALPGG